MRRMLMLAIPAVLVLGACSSDDDDEPEVSLDVTLPDVTLPGVTGPDLTIPDITIPDITIPDITLPDVSIPDISIPQSAEEALDQARDMLQGLGLDDAQIDCLIERIEEEGVQVPDVNDITGMLGDCDIEISDLQPGG